MNFPRKLSRSLPRPAWAAMLVLLLVFTGFGLTRIVFAWRVEPPAPPRPASARITLVEQPVFRNPPTVPAARAHLPDDAPVIGVSAGGRHRAYAVFALVPLPAHVVNDQLGVAPVSVTYCDLTDCVQVFTDPHGEGPLEISVGGWDGRPGREGMLLQFGPERYHQGTGQPLSETSDPFPYTHLEPVRTTWGQWRQEHPDTDVYEGGGAGPIRGSMAGGR